MSLIVFFDIGGSTEVAKLPDGSCRRFDDLQSHTREIVKDSCRIKAFVCFFGVLQELFRDNIPPKSEVLDIYGRVLINSFNIMNEEYHSIGIGLYLQASALDHSCDPNAAVVFDGRFIAVRCIEDSPNLSFKNMRISYVSTLMETEKRKKELREQYYFECDCPACDDEMDIERLKKSCMKCPACESAICPDVDKCDIAQNDIVCKHCNLPVETQHVQRYFSVRKDIQEIVYENVNKHPEPEEQCVDFFEEAKMVLHPFNKTYLWLLESCLVRYLDKEDWHLALECAKELLVAYSKFYPRYDVNTALLLMKLAKLSHFLHWSLDALDYVERAAGILEVTHGKKHLLFIRHLNPLMTNINLELQLKRQKEKGNLETSDLDRPILNSPTHHSG